MIKSTAHIAFRDGQTVSLSNVVSVSVRGNAIDVATDSMHPENFVTGERMSYIYPLDIISGVRVEY